MAVAVRRQSQLQLVVVLIGLVMGVKGDADWASGIN